MSLRRGRRGLQCQPGTPQDAIRTLSLLAPLVPGDATVALRTALHTAAACVGGLQNINLPLISAMGGELGVPQFGPAGTPDAVAGFDGSTGTQALLAAVKTLQVARM